LSVKDEAMSPIVLATAETNFVRAMPMLSEMNGTNIAATM